MNIYDTITDILHPAIQKLSHVIRNKQSLNTSIVGTVKEAKELINQANLLIVNSDYPDLKITADIEYANEDIAFLLINEFYNKTNDLLQQTRTTNDFFCRLLLYI